MYYLYNILPEPTTSRFGFADLAYPQTVYVIVVSEPNTEFRPLRVTVTRA